MSFNPEDYDIPDSYRHWEGDAQRTISGRSFLHGRRAPAERRSEFRPPLQCASDGARWCADVFRGLHAVSLVRTGGSESESVVTVSCNNEFIAPASEGADTGEAETIRRGRNMIFMRCLLRAGDQIVLTSSVIKRLGKEVAILPVQR